MALSLYNAKFILLTCASFITIFSSIAIYFILPIILSHVIRTQLAISPTSGSYNDWRLNSVIDRVYFYNISNYDELSQHIAVSSKPPRPVIKLKQVGPFAFRQTREKINIKFDRSNETVLYDQRKHWTYLPELSLVKDWSELNSTLLYHMNIPLAGTTLNAEYADFIDPIVSEFDLKLFWHHSVDLMLFVGYYDILMEQAKQGGQIDVDRFGWFHNMNNSLTRNMRVFTGPSNSTLDKFGAIDSYNNILQFNIYHSNNSAPNETLNVNCNDFRFSSAGEFFPPPDQSIISHNHHYASAKDREDYLSTQPSRMSNLVIDKDDTLQPVDMLRVNTSISLFMPDLCRAYRLYYNGTYKYKDQLLVNRYKADERTYSYDGDDNPNKCYCMYNETSRQITCPPNGMMDMYTCRKGTPLTVSLPHFLYSNKDKSLAPFLKMYDDDVEPDEREHQFYMDLESTLNIPVKAQIVLQFNVHYRNEHALNFTRDYAFLFDDTVDKAQIHTAQSPSDDLYLPQVWIKSNAEIEDKNLQNLIFIQQRIQLVTPLTTLVMFGFASILLMMSAKLAYDLTYGPNARKSITRLENSCTSTSQNEDSISDEKHKSHAMQLLFTDDSGTINESSPHKPTTSKQRDKQSLQSTSLETQPLRDA